MKTSPAHPPSIPEGLCLLGGWMNMLLGLFILVTGGVEGIGTGLIFLAGGVMFAGPIYYRERVRQGARTQEGSTR